MRLSSLLAPPPASPLDRGLWEAPRWAFFAAAGVVIAFAAFYTAYRIGWLDFRRFRNGGAR